VQAPDRSPVSAALPERCTRLTTRPASGMDSSASRSTKYDASRSASRSGAATTTKDVPGALSRSYVACARSRKPPNIVSSAATNCDTSCSTCAPMIRVMTEVKTLKPVVTTFR
jgi:hypothetical protein